MKSEDIIKAMMQCYAMDCDGCPFHNKHDCGKCEELIPIAIDLLKKQNEELAAYRAAEQDGTLLRLPCKVGDTVWFTKSAFSLAIFPIEANHVSIRGINRDGEIMYNCITSYNNIDRRFVSADIGKTVFLTREAAEAALKEQEANQ